MKTTIIKLFLVCSGIFNLCCCAQPEHNYTSIIPMPSEIKEFKGFYLIDSTKFFSESKHDFIETKINNSLEEEEYLLKVTTKNVKIEGGSEKAIFYGKQTLSQLITNQGIPCMEIKDKPRFQYRGFLLDVSRHFFPKEEIFKLLDEMARYKLNTFHFHLTDNGGWRIQIDSYPDLTRLGAFRTSCDWVDWWENNDRKYLPEGTPGAYGGYFTKEDIKEIVAYASERYINVIPEIEIPAHSDEVFIGYPELCCAGKPYSGGEFCVGNEKVYSFIENVLTEVLELFPSEMIHIGADEARMNEWKNCPKCTELMKKKGMHDISELQSHIVKYAEQFLIKKGRRMIGWDEILKDNIDSSSVVMCYRGQSGALTAASKGFDAILTTGAIVYYDWYQSEPSTQKKAMYGYSPLAKVYAFNPQPFDTNVLLYNELLINEPVQYDLTILNKNSSKHIIGVQGSAFTEYMPNTEHLEYMIFPRFLAISEIAWSEQKNRNWNNFKKRLNRHLYLLRNRGINTFQLSDEVDITTKKSNNNDQKISVSLDVEKYPDQIYYTIDGSDPSEKALIYIGPFDVSDGTMIKAALLNDNSQAKKIAETIAKSDSLIPIPKRWSWHE